MFNNPPLNLLRGLRRAQPRPPCLRCAYEVSHPSDHDPGKMLLKEQCRVNGLCTIGAALSSVGDRGGRNGLRLPDVREAGAVARGRPFNRSGRESHILYVLHRTEERLPGHCPRQGPAGGPRRGPLCRNPEEMLADHNRGKQRCSDSHDRGDRTSDSDGFNGDGRWRGGVASAPGSGSGRSQGGIVGHNNRGISLRSGRANGMRKNGARGRSA